MNERETGRFWSLPVFNSKTSAYVGSLHPYYHYECRVAAYTIAIGPYSESVVLLTEEEGETRMLLLYKVLKSILMNLLLFYPAPSSPPMTVLPQFVTSNSFTLSWQPPSFESRNGVIQQYIIQIEEINTGRMLTATSNTTEITVKDLHPFYSYSCRIAAETVEVGPYTSAITVQLNEDGRQKKIALLIE